jgi:hypothetical protein
VTVDRALRAHAATAEDTFVVYYAGHGLTTLKRHELYLGLPGTDVEALRVSALPFDVIREILAESPAANRVLVLDCCYSGRATHEHLGADDDVVLAQLDIEGTYTLASAPGTSIARFDAASTYTAFTGMLIDLLRTGVPGGPELLTLNEIYRRLRFTAASNDLPKPQRRGTGTTDLLAARVRPESSPSTRHRRFRSDRRSPIHRHRSRRSNGSVRCSPARTRRRRPSTARCASPPG